MINSDVSKKYCEWVGFLEEASESRLPGENHKYIAAAANNKYRIIHQSERSLKLSLDDIVTISITKLQEIKTSFKYKIIDQDTFSKLSEKISICTQSLIEGRQTKRESLVLKIARVVALIFSFLPLIGAYFVWKKFDNDKNEFNTHIDSLTNKIKEACLNLTGQVEEEDPTQINLTFTGSEEDGEKVTIKVPRSCNETLPLLKTIIDGNYGDKEIKIDLLNDSTWNEERLSQLFISFLSEEINGENAFHMLELSRRLMCENTTKKCTQFIAQHLEKSFNQKERTLKEIVSFVTETELGSIIEPALSESLSRKISKCVYESICFPKNMETSDVKFWKDHAKILNRFYTPVDIDEVNLSICLSCLSDDCIESINISNSANIKALNAATFAKFTNLQHLTISKCRKLESLDKDVFSRVTALKTLDISECDALLELHENLFSNLDGLKSLKLRGLEELNGLEQRLFSKLTALETLDISGCNGLLNLDKEQFSTLAALQTLCLSNCFRLKTLDKELFSKLISLKTLDISKCVDLPELDNEQFSTLTSLQALSISSCRSLKALGKDLFSKLTALETLDISNCTSLSELAKEQFSTLTSLLALNICDCTALKTLDKEQFSTLKALKTLNIGRCYNLLELDKDLFSKLTDLQLLDMRQCSEISKLDKDLFSNLSNLQLLNISHCGLRELNKDLFSTLTKLLTLDISYNNTESLDKGLFSELIALETLNISNNRVLAYLDEELFSKLTSLKTLDMTAYKELKTLASGLFSKLTSLQTLDISYCEQLERFEGNLLSTLTSLEALNIQGSFRLTFLNKQELRELVNTQSFRIAI